VAATATATKYPAAFDRRVRDLSNIRRRDPRLVDAAAAATAAAAARCGNASATPAECCKLSANLNAAIGQYRCTPP